MVLEKLKKVQKSQVVYVGDKEILWYIGDLMTRKSTEEIVEMSVDDLDTDLQNYVSMGKLCAGPVLHFDDDEY